MSKLHLGVLGSGAGSNMQSIVDVIETFKTKLEGWPRIDALNYLNQLALIR